VNSVIFYEKPVGALLSVYLGSVLTHTSVEHDPVSGSRSNRILQFKTGSGSDWISKNSTGSDMDIQTALITEVKCLPVVFFWM